MLTFDHKRLSGLRRRSDMTQAELARMFGVTPTALGYWEQGRCVPSSTHLVKLADFFGLHPRDFFEEESINWNGGV